MAHAATPFDFDELGASAQVYRPETSYSAAEMEAALEAARAEAVDTILAQETQKQTQLLQQISEQLSESAKEREESIAEIQTSILETARRIIAKISSNACALQKAENALTLLDSYITKIHNDAPVRLILPLSTPKKVTASIKKAISEQTTENTITVEHSDALTAGDCRIEWSGGSAAFSSHAILNQIDSIFRGARSPRNMQKGTPS